MALAAERIDDPRIKVRRDAEQDARDDRKIEAAVASLVGDVARKAAEAKGQLAGVDEQRSRANRDDSRDEEKFAEFAHRVHADRTRAILPESKTSNGCLHESR